MTLLLHLLNFSHTIFNYSTLSSSTTSVTSIISIISITSISCSRVDKNLGNRLVNTDSLKTHPQANTLHYDPQEDKCDTQEDLCNTQEKFVESAMREDFDNFITNLNIHTTSRNSRNSHNYHNSHDSCNSCNSHNSCNSCNLGESFSAMRITPLSVKYTKKDCRDRKDQVELQYQPIVRGYGQFSFLATLINVFKYTEGLAEFLILNKKKSNPNSNTNKVINCDSLYDFLISIINFPFHNEITKNVLYGIAEYLQTFGIKGIVKDSLNSKDTKDTANLVNLVDSFDVWRESNCFKIFESILFNILEIDSDSASYLEFHILEYNKYRVIRTGCLIIPIELNKRCLHEVLVSKNHPKEMAADISKLYVLLNSPKILIIQLIPMMELEEAAKTIKANIRINNHLYVLKSIIRLDGRSYSCIIRQDYLWYLLEEEIKALESNLFDFNDAILIYIRAD